MQKTNEGKMTFKQKVGAAAVVIAVSALALKFVPPYAEFVNSMNFPKPKTLSGSSKQHSSAGKSNEMKSFDSLKLPSDTISKK